jgi:hypothetical protein
LPKTSIPPPPVETASVAATKKTSPQSALNPLPEPTLAPAPEPGQTTNAATNTVQPSPPQPPIEPTASETVGDATARPPALLVVSTVADVSTRAGISESSENYAKQAAGEIAKRAGEILGANFEIVQQTVDDLRKHLQKDQQGYTSLCTNWRADILILSNFVISKSWSSIDSNYWPDYHIYLHNCETSRSRHEVYKHLNPSNMDRFPFEGAIYEKTMEFLSDSRWVADN